MGPEYTSADPFGSPCKPPGYSLFPDRFRRFCPFQCSVISFQFSVKEAKITKLKSGLHQLFLDVGDQVPDVGTAIQQFVEPRLNLVPCGGVTVECVVPLARHALKPCIHFTELSLEILLGGL